MRPALRGMCSLTSLRDGTVDLLDLALANDAIDCETENIARAREAER